MPLARLVLALTLVAPAVAEAQFGPGGSSAPVDVAARHVPPSFEVGGTMGLAVILPTFGGTVSMPAGRRASIDVVGQVMPWRLDDGDDTWLMTQVQLRIPFRERPRARRSLLVGLTSFTVGDRFTTAGQRREWDLESWVRPHAGVSWQWQRLPRIDMRLDVVGVFLGRVAPMAAPMVSVSTIWHRERRWSMRIAAAVTLVLAARLVLATQAAAQVAEDEPIPRPCARGSRWAAWPV